jgi:hypothetical protein
MSMIVIPAERGWCRVSITDSGTLMVLPVVAWRIDEDANGVPSATAVCPETTTPLLDFGLVIQEERLDEELRPLAEGRLTKTAVERVVPRLQKAHEYIRQNRVEEAEHERKAVEEELSKHYR